MFDELRKVAEAEGIAEILNKAIKATNKNAADLLRFQLSHGESGIGQLPPYSSARYAKWKRTKKRSKAPPGIMDLKKTGSFHRKIKFKNGQFYSTDWKNEILKNKYGDEILQLNEENFDFYINKILLPILLKMVENELL